MDDGTELECRAGDVSLLLSGHDAWVVGDQPAVVVDFQEPKPVICSAKSDRLS